jgi:hypothetical protein
MLACSWAPALANPTSRPTEKVVAIEKEYRHDGLALRLVNRSPELPHPNVQGLVDTFFKVYPVLRSTYNPSAASEVTILIDPEYKGLAEASGRRIRISSKFVADNSRGFDVITHEAMHLVQSYPGGAGPGWITEGIADYARHVHGVDNAAGGWSLPALRPNHKVTDSYRVTARFFVWIEKQVKPGFVQTLDKAMREKRYTESIWQQETGETLEALWARYVVDPSL